MSKLQLVRRVGITAGAAASLLLTLAPAASAGIPNLHIDPTSGPAGTTTITVQASSGCYPGDTLAVFFTPGFTGDVFAGGGTPIVTLAGNLTDSEGGSWSVLLPVPASAAVGPYTVDARCSYGPSLLADSAQRAVVANGFSYPSQEFQVTQSEPTTTTTTTLPSTTTTVPATTTTLPAVAAQTARPVPARPTYTG